VVWLWMGLMGCVEQAAEQPSSVPPGTTEPWTYGPTGTTVPTTTSTPTSSTPTTTSFTTTPTTTTPTTTTTTTPTTPTTPTTTTTTEPRGPCPRYTGFDREGQWTEMAADDGSWSSRREVMQISTSGGPTTVLVDEHFDVPPDEHITEYEQTFLWTYRCDADGAWLDRLEVDYSYLYDGVLYAASSTTVYDGYLLMAWDVEVGSSWESESNSEMTSPDFEETVHSAWVLSAVADSAGPVETEAGRFDALHVSWVTNGTPSDFWVDADVGKVRLGNAQAVAYGG
jgi:hypothetical protein